MRNINWNLTCHYRCVNQRAIGKEVRFYNHYHYYYEFYSPCILAFSLVMVSDCENQSTWANLITLFNWVYIKLNPLLEFLCDMFSYPLHNFPICKVVWFNFKICWILQNPDKFLIYFYFVEIKNVGYWSCAGEAESKKGPMEKSSTCRFRIVNNNLGCHIIYSPVIWFFAKPWWSSNNSVCSALKIKPSLNKLFGLRRVKSSNSSCNTLIISARRIWAYPVTCWLAISRSAQGSDISDIMREPFYWGI